ncbi:SEC-C domain-containing protein [bacterium]|nr:SEC-C domain-containing protein [bacterium]
MQIINEVLENEYTFEELMQEYKHDYLVNNLYSSATVLYCSSAFSKVFDIISTPQTNETSFEKVGRNEPCPCGSGKKYKNCCM